MNHIITDEEERRFYDVYSSHSGRDSESRKAALADFLNNRPAPVAETSQELIEATNQITELKNYISTIRPKHDAYNRVCETLGVEGDILGYIQTVQGTPVATLRPIAEMPDTVPEGCVRLFCTIYSDGVIGAFMSTSHDMDTHFIDIQLPTAPDPEADLRREFEEAMTKHRQWERSSFAMENGEYVSSSSRVYFEIWKLAKGAKP